MPKPPVFLFVFANDTQQSLKLSNEQEVIWEALQHAHKQGIIEYRALSNATVKGLYNEITHFSGRIALFHFGGHSDGDLLNLSRGETEAQNLAVLLGQEKNLKLVFLNGCANLEQVEDLFAKGIPAVIATTSAIQDDTAVSFAGQFYKAVAARKTIGAAYAITSAFIRDNKKIALSTEGQNWRSVVENIRGLAPRSGQTADELPWGLNHNNHPKALEWKLPRKVNNWVYALLLLPVLIVGLLLWNRATPADKSADGNLHQEPSLCPAYTDSATFKIAVLPFDAGALQPEREISNALNKWNKIHRSSHAGRALFLAESAVSGKKLEVINPSTLDSLWTTCGAQMVIGGYSFKKPDGTPFGVQLQLNSVNEVAIDTMTRLAYEQSLGFEFIDSLETWSAYIFSLIDGYFHCYDKVLAQKMKNDIAAKAQQQAPIADRLMLVSQYQIVNRQQTEAIRLLELYPDTVGASPRLIQNLGLCYVDFGAYKKASATLALMPESALSAPFLQFRWKTHRRAGYYRPAIADIDRLLAMQPDLGMKAYLKTEKAKMEKKLAAIDNDPPVNLINWKERVTTYLDQRKGKEAATIAKQYLNKNPREFDSYMWLLNIFLQKGYAELGCETINLGKSNGLSAAQLQTMVKQCGVCCVEIVD